MDLCLDIDDSRLRGNIELRQSTKHSKRYDRNNYKLEIKRCVIDDKGEYVVRATNSYGDKEYAVVLTVERKSLHMPLGALIIFLLDNIVSLSLLIDDVSVLLLEINIASDELSSHCTTMT